MKTVQLKKHKDKEWEFLTPYVNLKKPLVLAFGNRLDLEDTKVYKKISKLFPESHIVFVSTGGNITSETITEDCITITAVELEKSTFKVEAINLSDTSLNSYQAGIDLVNNLKGDKLKYILVLSEGSFVNGSELTKGMNFAADNDVLITGGLSGDDQRFERTIVSYNENPKDGEIVAIGFYGDSFEATSSTGCGWSTFGPERVVTKSKGNILYELDHKSALDLYEKYLGDKSSQLPASALYYPLHVQEEQEDHFQVRTILNVKKEYNAMIYAGNIPLNSKVQFMMTNAASLINASKSATAEALERKAKKPELAIFMSGIGRKFMLDQRAVEEIEEARTVLNNKTTICGFYSYGEIAPFQDENMCQLHNQTMAVTLISE
jgi:hypothetical protein